MFGSNGKQKKEWNWEVEANFMVENQLIARGIKDPYVLQAMRTTPRHFFVDKTLHPQAYADKPLAIGMEQTISQPYMVALMTELLCLEAGDKVLEIGTGSGYQTAILAQRVKEVYSIEVRPELSQRAAEVLKRLDIHNVRIKVSDGHQGWPETAPFDGIVVTAAPLSVPPALASQLKPGKRMVIPLGKPNEQKLFVITKMETGIEQKEMATVSFVPMITETGPRE